MALSGLNAMYQNQDPNLVRPTVMSSSPNLGMMLPPGLISALLGRGLGGGMMPGMGGGGMPGLPGMFGGMMPGFGGAGGGQGDILSALLGGGLGAPQMPGQGSMFGGDVSNLMLDPRAFIAGGYKPGPGGMEGGEQGLMRPGVMPSPGMEGGGQPANMMDVIRGLLGGGFGGPFGRFNFLSRFGKDFAQGGQNQSMGGPSAPGSTPPPMGIQAFMQNPNLMMERGGDRWA